MNTKRFIKESKKLIIKAKKENKATKIPTNLVKNVGNELDSAQFMLLELMDTIEDLQGPKSEPATLITKSVKLMDQLIKEWTKIHKKLK